MTFAAFKSSWAGWLALVRMPNLFTVPGDAMAGLAVASLVAGTGPAPAWKLVAIGAAALCLYIFGLLLNDLWDLQDDQFLRPERPLPRGVVRRPAAVAALLLLAPAALGLAWLVSLQAFAVALLLLPLIVLYNMLLKEVTPLACLNMGACRALAFLLGVAPREWLGVPGGLALLLGLYIGLVTHVARYEDKPAPLGEKVWGPPVAALLFALVINFLAWTLPGVPGVLRTVCVPLLTGAGVLEAVLASRRLGGVVQPARTRSAIGTWLRALIPLQAACQFLSPQTLLLGVVLAAGWPLSWFFGRRYSAS